MLFQVPTDLLAFLQRLLIHLHFLVFIRLEVILPLIPVSLHAFFRRVFYREHGGCGNIGHSVTASQQQTHWVLKIVQTLGPP